MNAEYIDASLIITAEWIDKNLVWETGRIKVVQPPKTESYVTTTTPTTTTMTTTTTAANNENNGTETKKKKPGVHEDQTNQVNINSIRAEKSQVWIPEIEILNRADDFPHGDEKERPVKITSNGNVRYTRGYRMRAMLSSSISFYPYDVQVSRLTVENQLLLTFV